MAEAPILRAYLTGYYGWGPLAQLPDPVLEAAATDAQRTVHVAGYGAQWEPLAASRLYRAHTGPERQAA